MKQFPSPFLHLLHSVEEILFIYLSQNIDCAGPTNRFFLRIGVGTGVFPVCGGSQTIDLRPAFRGTNTPEMYRLAINEVPSIGDCQ